jgi:phospholipase/carboxylesterase
VESGFEGLHVLIHAVDLRPQRTRLGRTRRGGIRGRVCRSKMPGEQDQDEPNGEPCDTGGHETLLGSVGNSNMHRRIMAVKTLPMLSHVAVWLALLWRPFCDDRSMTQGNLLDCIETQTGPAPTWSILWLHGLGADGNDFAPIVPQMLRPDWPGLRFVFPHAPVRAVTINGGVRMRAWYDILAFGNDFTRREDEAGVRDSIVHVERLIARERERGVPASRVILAGFSQGGAIALAAGVRRTESLAGIVALSTYLPLAPASLAEAMPVGLGTPLFMAHGSYDPVVPQLLGERSRDALRDAGVAVEWHSYPMQHQVCAEEIDALANWLGQRFAGP